MDIDESFDVPMHDGNVVASTEFTQSTMDPYVKDEIRTVEPNGSAVAVKSSVPTLKGSGIKRDRDVFDQHLTRLKDAPRPPKFEHLPYATSQTGLVYDVRMRFHVEAVPTEDDVHPEDPRRIHAIFEAFLEAGLAWKEGSSGPSAEYYMGRIDARAVTEEEVLLVHTKKHYEWIQSLSTKTAEELEVELQHPDQQVRMDSVYMSPNTPYCAALSAGGAIEACRAVMLGKVKNVFAVIRPPGHHAEREDAKGFCFFDNVSIATKVCQREFGEDCRKVLILDWDVHHGNGIQQANYDDPNVLYVSLHVHEKGLFYPEHSYRDKRGPFGDHLHCGRGAAMGRNVNIPWSKKGMGDADYIYAFQQVVMPIATEFNPDLVIIAAGFDAADGDMLGGCKVTPAGYAHMTHMLMSLAGGKLAVCLEGGYNLDSIARSACAVGRTMMGEPPERLVNTTPSNSGVNDIKLVLRQQSRFWSSLYPKDPSARISGVPQGERLHDVIRKWQATTMWDEYQMSPLFIHRESLSKSFENQVLATPDYMDERPLLVILHDPPELLASPDPRTGKLEAHNTWLTDEVKTYVAEAVRNGFAVMDVNLPKHITDDDDDGEHEESDLFSARAAEATQLLTYLWDNYISLAQPTHTFLMGTNIGHWAITNWIKSNEDTAMTSLTRTVQFIVDVSLQAVRSPTNDLLSPWYHRTSQIFLTQEHNFWAQDYAQKPKKKFGRLLKSGEEDVGSMLREHREQVMDLLLADTEEWRENRDVSEVEEDAMDVSESALAPKPPPVGNFALSPAAKAPEMEGSAMPTSAPALRLSRSPGR